MEKLTPGQFAALLDRMSDFIREHAGTMEAAATEFWLRELRVLDAYAQARAGGAVKVPDEREGYRYDDRLDAESDGWNACRAEVLRLNHPPAEGATLSLQEIPPARYLERVSTIVSSYAAKKMYEVLREELRVAALSGRKEGNANEPR